MGLTRGFLKGMGLNEEQISAIIDEHISVTNGLKDEIGKLQDKADKYSETQKELSDLKKSDWQKKYEDEHKAFDEYKKDVESKATEDKKKAAYRQMLLDAKVGEKHIDSILRVTDFSALKLKDDGTFEDAKKISKDIETAWSGFVTTAGAKGANVETPPSNEGSKVLTREEIMKIKDTTERQKAWADYLTKGAN